MELHETPGRSGCGVGVGGRGVRVALPTAPPLLGARPTPDVSPTPAGDKRRRGTQKKQTGTSADRIVRAWMMSGEDEEDGW
ncbi:unnamed protein product [Lampetra planeri]